MGGPASPAGYHGHVQSLEAWTSGGAEDIEMYWALHAMATDTPERISASRWDHDGYYDPSMSTNISTFVNHAALMSLNAWTEFDPEYFGYEQHEGFEIGPCAKQLLRMGARVLLKGGWTRESLRGYPMGNVSGGGGTDASTGGMLEGVIARPHNLRDMQRLSYVFGMIGPCWASDTACSAALTGACSAVMQLKNERLRPSFDREKSLKAYLCAAITGPFLEPTMFIGLAQAQMISRGGRCFTFNTTANGHFSTKPSTWSQRLRKSRIHSAPAVALICSKT